MRPSGGPTPDMINFAYSTNCYQHFADMIVYDRLRHKSKSTPCFCAFAGRWKEVPYAHSHQDIVSVFREELKVAEELPEILAHGMGNYMYLAKLESRQKMEDFFQYVLETQKKEEPIQEPAPQTVQSPADTEPESGRLPAKTAAAGQRD